MSLHKIKFITSILFFLTITMSGCGGGSSGGAAQSPAENPTQETNSAPVLEGEFELSLLALAESQFSLNASDLDGDALTVSVTALPGWVTYELIGGELTFTAIPDFFHLGSYTLNVTVSDGRLSSEYNVTIDIQPNTDLYSEVLLSTDVLRGVWPLPDGSEFTFFNDKSGSYKSSLGQISPLTWQIQDGLVQVNVSQPVCMECDNQVFTLQMVGYLTGGFRFHVFETDSSLSSDTDKRATALLTDGYYMAPTFDGPVLNFLVSEQHVQGTIDFYWVKTDSLGEPLVGKRFLEVDAALEDNNGVQQFRVVDDNVVIVDNLLNTRTNLRHNVRVNMGTVTANVSYSDAQRVHLILEYTPTLGEDLGDFLIEDFDGLASLLEPQIIHIDLYRMQTVQRPELEVGSRYISRFNASPVADNVQFFNGANELTIADDSQGFLNVFVAGTDIDQDFPVDWQLDGSTLTLTDNGMAHHYRFLENPQRQLVLLNVSASGKLVENQWAYPFLKAEQNRFDTTDLVGNYQFKAFLNYRNQIPLSLLLEESGNGKNDRIFNNVFFERAQLPDTWTLESDGTLRTLDKSQVCNSQTRFHDCLNLIPQSGQRPHIMNFTPFKIDGNKIYTKVTIHIQATDFSSGSVVTAFDLLEKQ